MNKVQPSPREIISPRGRLQILAMAIMLLCGFKSPVLAQCSPPVPGPGFSYGGMKYIMTEKLYDPKPDLQEQIKADFGAEARLVEWETLKSILSNPAAIATFMAEVGVRFQPNAGPCDNVAVSFREQTLFADRKMYFFSRHDGKKENYRVFDQISNHTIDLGAFDYRVPALVALPDGDRRFGETIADRFNVPDASLGIASLLWIGAGVLLALPSPRRRQWRLRIGHNIVRDNLA